jgi:HK97 family phage prohead protease
MKKGNVETRSNGEFRAVNDEGIFEGYLTVWDTVDSYNSTFKRGAFAKTIAERGNKIKIFFDHEDLIGKSLELREDDYGVFGRGQLNLDVEDAKNAFLFMKDGTIEGLSFGFNTIQESFENGVRVIKEVKLFEYGPVVFPANENADITAVRSTDFNQTLSDMEFQSRMYKLPDAICRTIDDIWFSVNGNKQDLLNKCSTAIEAFRVEYLMFAEEWASRFWNNSEFRELPINNELTKAFLETRKTVEEFCMETSLTKKELEVLKSGNLIEKRSKLDELPETIKTAHQNIRNRAVETLCTELRGSLSDVEKERFIALLGIDDKQIIPEPNNKLEEYLINFRKQLTGE